MSTSLLYHLWGVKDYTQRCIKFEGGAVWFHVDKRPGKRVCPRCGSANCILAGLVNPPPCLKTTPAGRKTVWLVLHLHRLECNDCGAIVQEDRIIADPKKHFTHLLAQYVLDMCDAFRLAVRQYYRRPCPIVYDRFHVTKMMNEVIDDIRREEMRNAESEEHRGVLKGQRYLLLYALENLEQSKVERLVALLKANERLSTSYILKEQLRLFWTQESRQTGETFLLDWIATAEASGIRQLKKFAKTLRNRWEGLLAYFDHRISSGPMEGTNTSIRNLMRKAYGFRDVEFLKLRILFIHECSVKFANA